MREIEFKADVSDEKAEPLLPRMLSNPWSHALFSCGILGLDLLTGPFLMFPILFVVPVAASAWFYSPRFALLLSVLLPVGRWAIAAFVEHPSPIVYASINALVRIAVLCLLAVLVGRTARQTKELKREISLLEGILSVCMFCKRIRDDQENWKSLETYIGGHPKSDFSHGMCPDCAKQHRLSDIR